jgi:phasin family protein
VTESVKPKATTARKASTNSAKSTKTVKPSAKSRTTRPTSTKSVRSRPVSVASSLVASRRRDAAALVDVGRKSYAGFTAVLKRQIELVKETLSELRSVAKVARAAGARETVTQLDQLARGSLQLSINSIRELSGLAASTQQEALGVLARRVQENLEELRQLRSVRKAEPVAK